MKRIALLTALMMALMLTGCTQEEAAPVEGPEAVEAMAPARVAVHKEPVPDIGQEGLRDDPRLYDEYDPTEVVTFYVTVRKGSAADKTDNTFEQINRYRNTQGMRGVEKIHAAAIVQIGDEQGPLPGQVGYGATAVNATINVRGRSSTSAPQKSYRLSLMDNAGLWRGQRDIALNKHPFDLTRLRNMIYFELLRDVSSIPSLRTQFVHLYIKDETDPNAPEGFVDHGLYTQVELPNKRYLRNHGLSRGGDLYKANMCEMYRYPDQLRAATDPAYDLKRFREVLEPKSDGDHLKLLRMLDALNDYSIPIEDIVERHFDLDNLTSFLAFNMLMGNRDSNSQNYFLYSPVNSETWYYLCWDGDDAMSYYEDELTQSAWVEGEWARGISNYWGVLLFNRMMRVEDYREALIDKVQALRDQITPERIAQMIARYRRTVDQYTVRLPDAIHIELPRDKIELVYQRMPYDVERTYQYFLESLKKPMPFYQGEVKADGDELLLSWDAAYDLNGEFITYAVQVASDWTFEPEAMVWEAERLIEPLTRMPMLPAHEYYWRVVATNEGGFAQQSFDQVQTNSGAHNGMRRFSVDGKGQVINE